MSSSSRTALSVNLNKVALVRNTRHLGIPSVTHAAVVCLRAGAQGITVHPRPDERHIRAQDVRDLHELLEAWPQAEFNIEGNPFHNLMDFVREFQPHQCTLVPDAEGQFTSDHGWDMPADAKRLEPIVEEAHSLGVRVSLFMDPVPGAMRAVRALGADRIELYTEGYARAFGTGRHEEVMRAYTETAQAALDCGLGVNAGHDLNRDNLTAFLRAVPGVSEVSIGHAFIADALELGYEAATRAYLACIARAFEGPGDPARPPSKSPGQAGSA
jgi:pyridoxine 5-phosphate synthase